MDQKMKEPYLIKLTHDNLDHEHICCAISSNKDVQVMRRRGTYISTACGYPGSSRGMGTPASCWTPASRTARRRKRRGL